MNEPEFVLLDRASRNFLGEFHTFEEAVETLRRFVAAEPSAIEHLEIWDGEVRVSIDPDTLDRVPAA